MKLDLDYEKLFGSLNKTKEVIETKKLIVSEVASRMRKVAFDVYNIENDPYNALWKLESNAEDGKDYLVRMGDEPMYEAKTGGWSAVSNENATSITLAYKNFPIQRLSSVEYKFNKEDVSQFKSVLLEKMATDNSFVAKMINAQPEEKKLELIKIFPELAWKK